MANLVKTSYKVIVGQPSAGGAGGGHHPRTQGVANRKPVTYSSSSNFFDLFDGATTRPSLVDLLTHCIYNTRISV